MAPEGGSHAGRAAPAGVWPWDAGAAAMVMGAGRAPACPLPELRASAAMGRRAASSRRSSSFSSAVRFESGGRTGPHRRPMSSAQAFTMGTGIAPPNFFTVRPHHLSDRALMAFRCCS